MSQKQANYSTKDSSKLLIDEPPLQVLPTLAAKIGLNKAIILQQVHYWLVIAKRAKDERKFKDDRWWVFNSYDEWQENFPWWSLATIKRIIYSLEAEKLLISEEMNAQDWDHKKWYSIDYDLLNGIVDCINLSKSDGSECDDRDAQSDTFINSNTENTSENTRKVLPKEEGKDLVDGYLVFMKAPGIKRQARIDAILSYLGGKLRINTETKRWSEFAKFVDDRQQSYNENIEIFVKWLVGQKNFDVQFWPPSKMREMWPQAFMIDEYAYTERSHAL